MMGRLRLYDDAILDAIDDFWQENYHPPTIRALVEMSGAKSTSVVWKALRRLAGQGDIVLCSARPIPLWVTAAIDTAQSTEMMCR